jgi:hypothetical protein
VVKELVFVFEEAVTVAELRNPERDYEGSEVIEEAI